jgi:hypothetical protein
VKHQTICIKQIEGVAMFHSTTLCAAHGGRGMTRLSDQCFAVHCLVAKLSVNSPLHCSALDGECGRLWRSPFARRNTLFTVARHAWAVTRSHGRGIFFSAPRRNYAMAI